MLLATFSAGDFFISSSGGGHGTRTVFPTGTLHPLAGDSRILLCHCLPGVLEQFSPDREVDLALLDGVRRGGHPPGVLGRSFGIVAANRGVVSSGPYRLVRHPIYLGYLVTHAGFLLSNTSVRNVAIYAAAYVFQFARIYAEERILAQDGEYREYLRSVRYRLFPEVY